MLLTADRIHNGIHWLPEGTIIETAEDGRILTLHEPGTVTGATHYEGIIAPGFVNVHCHLELSHMKGAIPEHTQLIPFLQQVTFHRNDYTEEQKSTARHKAYAELLRNGIVAVGDIANSTDTLDLREKGDLHIHTFVECIGFTEERAQQRFDFSKQVHDNFAAQKGNGHLLRQSIVPHAPYSVSAPLFKLIDNHQPETVISIHNQETAAENQFYKDKTGAVNDLLTSFGIDYGFFQPSGKTSLQTYMEWISPQKPVIFIHNTFTTKDDLAIAQARQQHAYWCLCPNANLYIENRLPDVLMLMAESAKICIGTDSLSSNHQLCILSELVTLNEHFPGIGWETLLRWATSNGAAALNMQEEIGTIEAGKKPGLVQILNADKGVDSLKLKRIV
ncbi:amidohydrolase family protein [Chitinophagaceae bacterium MMS25-I14]